MKYTISDGNVSECNLEWDRVVEMAEDWYTYLLDDRDDLSINDTMGDFNVDDGDIAALNEAISLFQTALAEKLVAAGSQAVFSLSVELEDDEWPERGRKK
jgi:hypothetical protein